MKKLILILVFIYTLLAYHRVNAESDIQKVILDNLFNYESDTFIVKTSDVTKISDIWGKDEILNHLTSVSYSVYNRITTLKLNRKLSKEDWNYVNYEIDKIDVKSLQEANDYIKTLYSYDYTLKPLNFTLYGMLKSREGICTSYSYLFDRLAKKLGYESRTVKGKTPQGYHLWNQVMIGDKWLNFDITWNDIIGYDRYMFMTDEFLIEEGRVFITERVVEDEK